MVSALAVWDRYLTLDGKRAYHIGNICNTCAFFFERLEGANQSVSPSEVGIELADGLPPQDEAWIQKIGQILPPGEYLTSLQVIQPRLVKPSSADDYFCGEQLTTWGIDPFWGLPHYPKTEYYRGRSTALGDGQLFEFVVPIFPSRWLKADVIATYRSRSTSEPTPTALAISILDVKQPATSEQAHWCLAHYLLDGHHKTFASAEGRREIGLLSFLALGRGVSSDEQAQQALEILSASN
jgi:hypothetical protein